MAIALKRRRSGFKLWMELSGCPLQLFGGGSRSSQPKSGIAAVLSYRLFRLILLEVMITTEDNPSSHMYRCLGRLSKAFRKSSKGRN